MIDLSLPRKESAFTVAHLSDMHIGRSPKNTFQAKAIFQKLLLLNPNHIVVTGDTANWGRHHEYAEFKKIFKHFFDRESITVIPGNHDRLGDEAAIEMLGNKRVHTIQKPGLRIVAVDSTGSHNRYWFLSHGKMDRQVVREVEAAVEASAPGELVVVAMHHHLIPQPEEIWLEKMAHFLRLPFAEELALGQHLIGKLVGRADLVLHGHRHVPMQTIVNNGIRPLGVFNAGSSTDLGKFRIFTTEKDKPGVAVTWVDHAE